MRCLYKYLLVLWVVLCWWLPSSAQDSTDNYVTDTPAIEGRAEADSVTYVRQQPVTYNQAAPNDREWRSLAADKAFGYKDENEYVPVKEQPYQQPGWVKVLLAIIAFFYSVAGKILLFGLLALLVGYIAYRILTGEGRRLFARKNKIQAQEETTVADDADLLASDWKARLDAALKANDLRLAVRYSYLLLLQMLQQKELIVYRQDKTNTEYFYELPDTPMRTSFRQLLRQYEYAWFGNFVPSPAAFEVYMQTFNSLKNQLQ